MTMRLPRRRGLPALIAAAALTAGMAATASPAQAQGAATKSRELRFETKPAMYAANEEWLTFACELPDGQVNIGSTKAWEMYYYSRYGLGNLLFRSGMGVHIVHNPLFDKHAEDDVGMPWYQEPDGDAQFFHHKVAQFVKRTGAHKIDAQFPPKGVYPVYLEYASGVPAFQTEPVLNDFNTLRWDPASMDQTLNPGAWGQSMMKQVLWARDFFTHHKTIDGVEYLGNNKDDGGNGFRGAALTAQAITKSFALKSALAYHARTGELGGVDPASYDPAQGAIYYPHAYEVVWAENQPEGMPPKPAGFRVTDTRSDLFDVASLLWAESEFYFYTDPTIEDDYNKVFGDPKWNPHADQATLEEQFAAGKAIFPLGPHKLSKGLSVVNIKNLRGLHFNADHGTLVDAWSPEAGQGTHVSLDRVGMAMVALANAYHHLHDVAKPRQGARMMLDAQARFLLDRQREDGSFAAAYELDGNRVRVAESTPTLKAQAFAIRGLLDAYHATGTEDYRRAAEATFDYMEDALWSESAGVYRTEPDARRSTYDGTHLGVTIGALRELAMIKKRDGETAEQRHIVARLDSFFENVGQTQGLQLSEIGATGEPIPSLEQRHEMMSRMETMKSRNPAKAREMMAQMADRDGDGVPKPPFVPGTRYGAAPVQAATVTLNTE